MITYVSFPAVDAIGHGLSLAQLAIGAAAVCIAAAGVGGAVKIHSAPQTSFTLPCSCARNSDWPASRSSILVLLRKTSATVSSRPKKLSHSLEKIAPGRPPSLLAVSSTTCSHGGIAFSSRHVGFFWWEIDMAQKRWTTGSRRRCQQLNKWTPWRQLSIWWKGATMSNGSACSSVLGFLAFLVSSSLSHPSSSSIRPRS